ncbi:SpoIIE family protein phosphatase [Blastococcus sp. BMG 814]|uniref:SpoIIE family protein phosphatase n=1 Tax=Blastococcus carthaginiensis TaxID=3050034 RepID=A0ABT9IGL1_9ACTN|nr:SpoIIE family protein phosphatase [Blastococcus carthaginiensis]MDP5184724.1 SpoIIE family protein phosphatase [Blastococcus carthaginiensis]
MGSAALNRQLAELIPGNPRSELQRMVLEHDWADTPLGPQQDWSPTLRSAVSICLNSRFPMLLMWGPELVMVYNDGYAPILGGRHPAALGERVADVWPDVWADIEPMIAEVYAGGATYDEDLPLVMTRHGYDEETYFTFAYSPVVEPGGAVVGLLDTVVETTSRVLTARRLGVLQRLGSLPRAAHGDTTEAVVTALELLADARPDCPFGLVYLADDAGVPRFVAGQGLAVRGGPATGDVPEQVFRAMATGEAQTVTGLAELLPGFSIAGASPAAQVDVDTAVVLPLTAAGAERPIGALVLGASPHLPLDDDYRVFMALVAGQVAATVADAQAVAAERRRAEERARSERARAQFFTDVAVTLQRAVLGPTVLPEGFAVHYEPAAGTLEVGGDWYDVVDLPGGGYGVVVGDVVGRGLPAAAVMGQLRSAGRALLLESRSPSHALEALDRFAAMVPGAAVSTVFCAVLDPRTGSLRYSSAGHPPAVLAEADGGTRLLEDAASLPLAVVEGLDRPEAEVVLPAGSTLLLYTDGLVERRDEAMDEGIGRAAAALAEGRHLGPAELKAQLTERLLGDAPDDDVAFVLVRRS